MRLNANAITMRIFPPRFVRRIIADLSTHRQPWAHVPVVRRMHETMWALARAATDQPSAPAKPHSQHEAMSHATRGPPIIMSSR